MSAFDDLITRARQQPARVALPEATDPRIVEAAINAAADGRCTPVLVGKKNEIIASAAEPAGVEKLEIIDTSSIAADDPVATALFERRKHKGMDLEGAVHALSDPLTYACTLVHSGDVDACVAGAEYATADVTRTAMQIVGTASDASFVSSFFLMVMQHDFQPLKDIVAFADCALMVDPNAEQLAEIALQTAHSTTALLGTTPRIGMLSFSTAGSAKHPHVEKVQNATAQVRKACSGTTDRADWKVIGDVQLDAAVIPGILSQKAPEFANELGLNENPHEPSAKLPNVLIFPTLDAGNIGYKLCERFGGCDAVGPVLQGLARPVNDLSRGCKTSDIERILAITSLQARA